MPINYLPSAVFTPFGSDAAAIPTPDSPTGLIQPIVNLTNGVAATRACLYSYLDWDQRVWTQGTLANTGNIGVYVGGINAIALLDTTTIPTLVRVFNLRAPTQVNVGVGSLSPGVPHYLYAYINAGSLAVEASTTAPEQDFFHWKSGASFTHRYLGSFRTDSTGVPFPFYALRGEFRYAFPEIADTGADSLQPWGPIVGPGVTDLDIGSRLPAMTLPVRTILRIRGLNADVGTESVTIAPQSAFFGGTIVNTYRWDLLPGQYLQDEITLEPSATRRLNIAPATSDVEVRVYCRGWVEPGFP
jgi:hypothetical protein